MSSGKLKVQVSSDVDYEFLIAEIMLDVGAAVIVSRDEAGQVYVQTPRFDQSNAFSMKVRLEDFERALEDAKFEVSRST